MNEQAKGHSAHVLQGPHTEWHHPETERLTPLRVCMQPGGARIEINHAEAVIGRHSQADIRVPAPEVSRRHCRLVFEAGKWRIVDLQSLNGLYVNGQRVGEAVLFDGDRVRVGGCTLLVERGTPLHPFRGRQKKTDPYLEVLQSIAQVLPRQAS